MRLPLSFGVYNGEEVHVCANSIARTHRRSPSPRLSPPPISTAGSRLCGTVYTYMIL
jgi:hypothetical protein